MGGAITPPGPAIRHRGIDHGSFTVLRSTRAGFPATMVWGATLLVTTLPAPTSAPSPISTPHRIVDPDPIEADLRTMVGTTVQSAAVCGLPSAVTALGYRSLMNVTAWPTKTSSSISTP